MTSVLSAVEEAGNHRLFTSFPLSHDKGLVRDYRVCSQDETNWKCCVCPDWRQQGVPSRSDVLPRNFCALQSAACNSYELNCIFARKWSNRNIFEPCSKLERHFKILQYKKLSRKCCQIESEYTFSREKWLLLPIISGLAGRTSHFPQVFWERSPNF